MAHTINIVQNRVPSFSGLTLSQSVLSVPGQLHVLPNFVEGETEAPVAKGFNLGVTDLRRDFPGTPSDFA